MPHQSFLLVKLEIEEKAIKEINKSLDYISNNITVSLKSVFGECGAAIPFSVVKYCPDSNSVILSCPDTGLVKLRTALTLQSTYQGFDCCYSVEKVVKDLISLSA